MSSDNQTLQAKYNEALRASNAANDALKKSQYALDNTAFFDNPTYQTLFLTYDKLLTVDQQSPTSEGEFVNEGEKSYITNYIHCPSCWGITSFLDYYAKVNNAAAQLILNDSKKLNELDTYSHSLTSSQVDKIVKSWLASRAAVKNAQITVTQLGQALKQVENALNAYNKTQEMIQQENAQLELNRQRMVQQEIARQKVIQQETNEKLVQQEMARQRLVQQEMNQEPVKQEATQSKSIDRDVSQEMAQPNSSSKTSPWIYIIVVLIIFLIIVGLLVFVFH